MSILVIDNYDSFTFNLVSLLRTLGQSEITVLRNDKVSVEDAARYTRIILSPGPGIPLEAGAMPAIVRALAPSHPILGVCLGHQCIGEVFGGTLVNLKSPVHGKAVPTKIIDPEEPLFRGLPLSIKTGRYHSWIVSSEKLPECLAVTAVDESGNIMALRHRSYNVRGVQFHPESVLTEYGEQMLGNWLNLGA